MPTFCLRCHRTYSGYRCLCSVTTGEVAYLLGAPVLYAALYVLAGHIDPPFSGLVNIGLVFLLLFGWVPAAVATLNILVGSWRGAGHA